MWNERKESPFRIVAKSYARYKKHGYDGMCQRLYKEYSKINFSENTHLNHVSDYKRWIDQNEQDILKTKPLAFNPLISIITPTYNTDKKYLTEMLESVLAQTYDHWELCIADDASNNAETLEVLKMYEVRFANIKVNYRKENGHISKASNTALSLARGSYVVFLDHDDTLAPNALYEMALKLNQQRDLKLIYSDEDKIDENSKRFNPHFKSGWNPDLFFSHNYICHLVLLEKKLVDRAGGLREGYEGSQDYDLLLRCLKYIDKKEIARIEKILYHWRAIEGSTAYGSSEKNYAHNAGLRALEEYFSEDALCLNVKDGLLTNTYKVEYPDYYMKDGDNQPIYPLVSLLVPTRDGYEVLHKCVDGILEHTLYPNYEIIILDNETTCPKTLAYFEKIQLHENVRILEYHHPFNYSAINNFGVQHAEGEIIGLINDDVEVITKRWLSEMVSLAIREGTGAVGAKLYYDNHTLQHAGVILGIGGVAGHSHKYFPQNADGYFSRLKVVQNYSAVTGACLVVKKALYEEVGGLNEKELTVAFNDVDFCLKLLEKGYKNVWTPYVELYHHESVSRGEEDNPEKMNRFNEEVTYMQKRWKGSLLEDGYYNKNLSDTHEDFGLRIRR